MMYVNNNDKKLVVCCGDENKVCAEAMVSMNKPSTVYPPCCYMGWPCLNWSRLLAKMQSGQLHERIPGKQELISLVCTFS